MITPKFVFARYNEDIDWIYNYPLIANNSVIYNKGEFLYKPSNFNTTIVPLSNNPNYGRESDTYLKHIVNNYLSLDDYIIFSQANPFDHSPEFIDIVHHMYNNQLFKAYQPLSCGWKSEHNVPPKINILYDNREFIDTYKLYMDLADHNLNVLGYTDIGILPVINDYKKYFKIKYDTSILHDLYQRLELFSKPFAGFIKFNYGGIFGVTKNSILLNSKKFYINLNKFVLQHYTAGFMMERLWYTIFLDNII